MGPEWFEEDVYDALRVVSRGGEGGCGGTERSKPFTQYPSLPPRTPGQHPLFDNLVS